MPRIAFFSLLLSVFLVNTSCKSPEQKKAEALKKQVHELHDELMLKSEDLAKLKKDLGKSLSKAKGPIQKGAIKGIILLINAAQSFMDDWMKMYSEPDMEKDLDGAISYYEKQLSELQRMKDEMTKAEDKAKEWIEKFENK